MPTSSFQDMNAGATLIAIIAGIWGSVLNFIKRDTKHHNTLRKISIFIMDMFVNIGITMLVYIGAIGYGLNELIAVAIAGFMGHQGTRSFHLIELMVAEKVGAKETFKTLENEIRK